MDVNGAPADWELLIKQYPNYVRADQVRMYIEQAKKQANIKSSAAQHEVQQW